MHGTTMQPKCGASLARRGHVVICSASTAPSGSGRQAVRESQRTPMLSSKRLPTPAALAGPVVVTIPERPKPSSPEPVPIIHSSAYLSQYLSQRDRSSSPDTWGSDSGQVIDVTAAQPAASKTVVIRRQPAPSSTTSNASTSTIPAPPPVSRRPGAPTASRRLPDEETFSGSAIEWAMRKADASLDELEANPPPLHRAIYGISRGPVGTATSSAVAAAGRLTVQATKQVVRAATPMAKWALSAGAKAAVGLIRAAVVEGVRAETQRASKMISTKSGSSSDSQESRRPTVSARAQRDSSGNSSSGPTGTTRISQRK